MAPQIRQNAVACDAPWDELARDKSAGHEGRRLADETGEADEAGKTDKTDETEEWGKARTPEAEALLLSRAVALGLDRLLYER